MKGILLYKLENQTLLERFTELCSFTHVPVVMVKLKKIQYKWSHLNAFGLEILLQVTI
jgi:hypothetical protein